MMVELAAEQWAEIDALILACNSLKAVIHIREACGIGLGEAIEIHVERYRLLRKSRADEFACSHEEYWRDVYS